MFKTASTRPRSKVILAVIIFAAAALYLLGNDRISLWDRDEPRYAQCSRQMLNGYAGPGAHGPGFIVPHFLNDLRTEKPPLIYWLQATAMRWLGDNAFAARLPSAVAMIAVLLLLAVVFYRGVGPTRAVWAVFIMATSALTVMSAKMCLTDATLLLFTTIAQICVYAIYRGNRSGKVVALLWCMLGPGGLTKGPIVLATIGATIIALLLLDRWTEGTWNFHWWRALRVGIGVAILAAINGPWLYLVNREEPTFLPRLYHAAARHVGSVTEKHTAPPGFYLATIWGLFFPWCLLLPTTMTIAFRNRRIPLVRYCLAVTLGVWVIQEAMPTKLPFYILPTFPALALLTADALIRSIRRQFDDLHQRKFIVAVAVFCAVVVLMGLGPWLMFGGLPMRVFHASVDLSGLAPRNASMAITIGAIVYAGAVLALFSGRKIAQGAIAMGVGAAVLFAVLFGAYLPNADYLRLTPRLAATLREKHIAPGDGIMIEYKEPGLAFYEGGDLIENADRAYLEKTPPGKWPTWIIMPRTLFDAKPEAIRAKLQVIGEPVRGINYAGKIDGRQAIDVMILKKRSE
jgi:4-amino-4-deoxy-L-arabinose transferase-like glycosyltransferase